MNQYCKFTRLKSVVILFVVALFSFDTYAANTLEKSKLTINTFKTNTMALSFFDRSYGWAVFPTIGKGGLGIGAAHGKGVLFEQGTAIGIAKMTQLSLGFLAGGQAYSEIIFFKDKKAFDRFKSGKFEFSANASAIAIKAYANASSSTVGNTANAGVDEDQSKSKAGFVNGMAVITLAKGGLMYEASLAGQKYRFKPFDSKNSMF